MGLGTQPKEGHNDYSTLIGQTNRQEAGADMGIGLGTSSTTPQRDIVPEQLAWQSRSQAGVCVSPTCAQGTGRVLPESPSGSGPAAFGVQHLLNVPDTAGCKPHFPP